MAELRAFWLVLAVELRNTLQLTRLSSYRRKRHHDFSESRSHSLYFRPRQKGMSEIYGDVRTKHIKLDIVGLSGDFLARAKRRTLKEINRRDGDSQIASSVPLLVEFWCQDVARILPIFAKIPGPTVLAVTPANPRDSFLSGERQLSRAAPVDALRGNDERERLARLRATYPFALAFSYILVAMPWPLNHAEACKESDVRRATFPARLFLRLFIKPHYLPPKAIYLIYRFFSMRRK